MSSTMPKIGLLSLATACCLGHGLAADSYAKAPAHASIRSQAAVVLSFDESAGDAVDSALGGAQPDYGKLAKGANRVESPFWGQAGRRALQLDGKKKQYVRLDDSVDLDGGSAVSLSFFFLNLQTSNARGMQGILAKRQEGQEAVATNYGIRFDSNADVFQIYVDDGTGLRSAAYSAEQVLGERRRVFLTVTIQRGDAPGLDADETDDDLLVRLYVNGKKVAPREVQKGVVDGEDAWLVDLGAEQIVNDAPLIIGGSNLTAEFATGLVDEFSLYSRALEPREVARLFAEVAGPDSARLARAETRPVPKPPRITGASMRGLRAGGTTTVTIFGEHFSPKPALVSAVANFTQSLQDGVEPERLMVDLTIPAETPLGIYPFRIQTKYGLSNPLPLAVDRLPQLAAADFSAEHPATLPASFSGTLTGAERPRLYFHGKAGQRIVADVEARRLGAMVEPVLEIKNEGETPLLIEWGKVFLQGDSRAELELPADGLYCVELHDLAYKAPKESPFRLKIGDLRLVDMAFPPVSVQGTELVVEPIGTGLEPGSTFKANMKETTSGASELLPIPEAIGASGPAPVIQPAEGIELLERRVGEHESLQEIDGRFTAGKRLPTTINGRIEQADERDRYLLTVTPGDKLSFSVSARAMNSPLDAEISLWGHPEKKEVEHQTDRPDTRDPAITYTVPKDVSQLVVAIRDLYDRGGSHFVYRLRIAPADFPRFELTMETSEVNLPRDGRAVVELNVERFGYKGPIKLSVLGDKQLTVSPTVIPPANSGGKFLLTLSRTPAGRGPRLRGLRLMGESVDGEPVLRRVAQFQIGPGKPLAASYQAALPVAAVPDFGLAMRIEKLPEVLLKGLPEDLSLTFAQLAEGAGAGQVARLTLMSTEEPRRNVNIFGMDSGNKPLVRSRPDQTMPADSASGVLTVDVPNDVTAQEISFVVRADILPHRYSNQSLGTVYSEPFRLPVKDALAVKLAEESPTLTAGIENKVQGTIEWAPQFKGKVEIQLRGLPEGYAAPKITVTPDQREFALPVTPTAETEIRNLDFVTLNIESAGGGALIPAAITLLTIKPHEDGAEQVDKAD